jgi:hypothetical protein
MTNKNRANARVNLGALLTQSLINKFGELPSATKFADKFNLRAHGTTTITRETARKWMLGLSVPEIDKLSILVKWLEIDPAEIFKTNTTKSIGQSSVQLKGGKENDLKNNAVIKAQINDCFNHMNDEAKKALFLAALMLRQLETPQLNLIDFETLIREQLKRGKNQAEKTLDLAKYNIKL